MAPGLNGSRPLAWAVCAAAWFSTTHAQEAADQVLQTSEQVHQNTQQVFKELANAVTVSGDNTDQSSAVKKVKIAFSNAIDKQTDLYAVICLEQLLAALSDLIGGASSAQPINAPLTEWFVDTAIQQTRKFLEANVADDVTAALNLVLKKTTEDLNSKVKAGSQTQDVVRAGVATWYNNLLELCDARAEFARRTKDTGASKGAASNGNIQAAAVSVINLETKFMVHLGKVKNLETIQSLNVGLKNLIDSAAKDLKTDISRVSDQLGNGDDDEELQAGVDVVKRRGELIVAAAEAAPFTDIKKTGLPDLYLTASDNQIQHVATLLPKLQIATDGNTNNAEAVDLSDTLVAALLKVNEVLWEHKSARWIRTDTYLNSLRDRCAQDLPKAVKNNRKAHTALKKKLLDEIKGMTGSTADELTGAITKLKHEFNQLKVDIQKLKKGGKNKTQGIWKVLALLLIVVVFVLGGIIFYTHWQTNREASGEDAGIEMEDRTVSGGKV